MTPGDNLLVIAEGFTVHEVKAAISLFGRNYFTKKKPLQIKLINSSNTLVYTLMSLLIMTETWFCIIYFATEIICLNKIHAENRYENQSRSSGLFSIFTEKLSSWNLVTYHCKYVFTLKIMMTWELQLTLSHM